MTQQINFEANLVAIAAVLAAHGIHQVTSTYQGSGDSGDEGYRTAFDAEGDEVDLPDVEVVVERRDYRKVGDTYDYVVEKVPMALDSAISDATGQVISLAGHEGYENNEGGEGTLTIYASGYATLVHTDFFEGDADSETFEFGADGTFGETLARMAAMLKANGCSAVQGEYTGSGDSGDGFDIAYFGEDKKQVDASIDEDVSYTVVELTYANGKFAHVQSTRTADFEQAFEDVCFAMVSASGRDGWENNEGGGGKLVITAEGTATLEHYTNGENDSSDDSHSWNDHLRQETDVPADEVA
jgi:hypothetical protein